MICSQCGLEKVKAQRNSRKCLDCLRQNCRDWHNRNRAKVNEHHKKVRKENPERTKARDIEYKSKLPRYLRKLATTAVKRGGSITLDDVTALWDKQRGLCALTGLPMTYRSGSGRVDTNVSLDRIDSTKSYTPNNIQLVCDRANIMKAWGTEESLLDWAKLIAYHLGQTRLNAADHLVRL